METCKTMARIFMAMAFAFIFHGCEELRECIFNINPEIHDKRLSVGVVGEDYYDIITAEVDNEVRDDDYIYDFDVFGEIPPGIVLDFDRRSIEIFGIPEKAGDYTFEVELFVSSFDEDGYDGSPTCSDSTVREFTIRILD